MKSATPFLMFQGNAREVLDLYVSVFPEAHFEVQTGVPLTAVLTLKQQRFRIFDSPIKHGFGFTPSFSIFVDCDSAAELDAAFARLAEGGEVRMAIDNHGFSPRFGWVDDRFGVSWQLNLPE